MSRTSLDARIRTLLLRGGDALAVLALAIAGLLIIKQVAPFGFSASPDVAHHYALIRWLMEHWAVGPDAPAVLDEMAVYPRYAHALAAIIGTIAHSPFIGMQLVASLALVSCWGAVAYVSRLFPGAASWAFSLVFFALLALNNATAGFDLFGHEIVVNYFFPQLVGQACFMVVVVLAARLERKYGDTSASLPALGVIVMSLAFAGIHLLPAMEGVAYGLILLATHVLSSRERWLARTALLLVATAAAAVLLLHLPAFRAMRAISENNGYLPLAVLDTLPRLITLAGVTGLLSLALVGISIPGHRFHASRFAAVARHLGSAGAAIAALCILQALAAAAGVGSNYACRKYAFGLVTFAVMNFSALVAYVAFRRREEAREPVQPLFGWIQPAALLMALWWLTFPSDPGVIDAKTFLPLEQVATLARDDGALAGDRQAYARGLVVGQMSTVANYLVSQAIFHAPRDANGMAPLFDRDFPNPAGVGAIFTTASNASVWSAPDCRRSALGHGFVVTDGQCLAAKFSDECRDDLNMAIQGFLPGAMMTGFGDPEPAGRWTIADKATFTCRLSKSSRPTTASIDVQPFSPNGRPQVVEISINGGPVARRTLTQAATFDVEVPSSGTAPAKLQVSISVPSAVSPRDVGLSEDGRKLGVMVSHVRLMH
jgi:hypothetical protein